MLDYEVVVKEMKRRYYITNLNYFKKILLFHSYALF